MVLKPWLDSSVSSRMTGSFELVRSDQVSETPCGVPLDVGSRKHSPAWNIAGAAANDCRSSEDGDVVDEVVVVEIMWRRVTLLVPFSLSSNLVRAIRPWMAGTSTHSSSISVMIHPPPEKD